MLNPLKMISKFAASPFSGYALIALVVAAAGAGYWFWSELKEFGSLEVRAEEQAKVIAQKNEELSIIRANIEAKDKAIARQTDRAQILNQQAGLLRQKLKEASDAATKALKSCLDMRIADGMRFGPSRESGESKARSNVDG